MISGCSLNVDGGFTGRSTALLVDTRTRPASWLMPTKNDKSKVLHLDRGQTFVASCPGSRNQVSVLEPRLELEHSAPPEGRRDRFGTHSTAL